MKRWIVRETFPILRIFVFASSLLLFVWYVLNLVCSHSPTATPVNQQIRTAVTTESPPTKYNLMEEIYGRKWSENPADMYLSSVDCTIGNNVNITTATFMTRVIEEFFFHFRTIDIIFLCYKKHLISLHLINSRLLRGSKNFEHFPKIIPKGSR